MKALFNTQGVRKIAGAGLCAAALLGNEYTIARLLHRPIEFSTPTRQNILFAELGLLLLAYWLIKPDAYSATIEFVRTNKRIRWLLSPVRSRLFWYSLLPVFMLSTWRQIAASQYSEFGWHNPITLLTILEGSTISALFITGLVSTVLAATDNLIASLVVAAMCAVCAIIDALFSVHSNTRISWRLTSSSLHAAPEYLQDQTTWIAIAAGSLSLLCVYFIRASKSRVEHTWFLQRLFWAALIGVFSPVGIATRVVTAPLRATDRASIETHRQEALRYTANPTIVLLSSAFSKESVRVVDHMPEHESALLRPYRGSAIATNSTHRYARRIVLVTMESLTNTLTSRYNHNFSGILTPFIDSQQQSCSNFYSVSIPTQYGLASHLCGHPNGEALVQAHHPNAVPKYLAAHGWITAYFQSAPLSFQAGMRRFREMGYEEMYGRDEAASDARYRSFISDWGLCDRKVYERATEWMSLHRNDTFFVHILTADTHGPAGRLNWCGLRYPHTPDWIEHTGNARLYLQSWFRADYDLGQFVDGLKRGGLLDSDTVLIVTGDHACPGGPTYHAIAGDSQSLVERIPWILISTAHLPLDTSRMASQADTAPTIAKLAGLRPMPEWWGTDLLSTAPSHPLLGWREHRCYSISTSNVIEAADGDISQAGWIIESAVSEIRQSAK